MVGITCVLQRTYLNTVYLIIFNIFLCHEILIGVSLTRCVFPAYFACTKGAQHIHGACAS